jgi:hypothetical protein
MKTKSLVLAIVAFTFAIGAAVASTFAAQNIFVKVRYFSGGPQVCLDTQFQCNELTGGTCQVTIPLQTGSDVASNTGTKKTYKATCATVLHSSSSEIYSATIPQADRPFELIP